jgi:hypothetical protein
LVTQLAHHRNKQTRHASRAARRRLRALLPLVLALPLVWTAPALAQQSGQSYNYSSQGGISVEQAAAAVRRETGGRVLSANPVRKGGERGFEVRVLIDGKRVKQYYVDSEGRLSPK